MPSVELVDYQPTWPEAFERVARELEASVSLRSSRIEHIGSTAVPGLCAKPVLDVLMGVPALQDVEFEIPRLAERGFRYRPEYEEQIPQRRYFVRDAGSDLPRVHLHVVVFEGEIWQRHLVFRDALRRDPALAARYAKLKQELAATEGLSKSAYTEAKAPFIHAVLSAAPSGGGGSTPTDP